MPLTALAQINGAGYYRVQNKASQRFLLLVDNRGSINWSNTSVDLGAFQTIGTFDENVCWNPATICYIEGTSKANFYNISGQGLDLYKITNTYMKFTKQNDGSYIISGEATKAGATVAKTLYDSAKPKNPADINTGGTSGYQYWYVRPVKSTGNYYFGIKPDFQATMENNDRYYTTVYASFPFQLGSGMKAYYPTAISGQYVKVGPLVYTVPAATPVIIECSSDQPTDNRVDIKSSSASTTGNRLTGVYYCNDVIDAAHRNVTEYRPTNMRVLGKAADGRLAFITDRTLKYIPANKAYLTVPTGTPETLYVCTVFPENGIETVAASDRSNGQHGVYSLSGQRVADTTDGLQKGVYIVNGRKTVVR